MPEYIIRAPDGKRYSVQTPAGTTQEEALAYLKQQLAPPPPPSAWEQIKGAPGAFFGSALRTATVDPLSGLAATAYAVPGALGAEQVPFEQTEFGKKLAAAQEALTPDDEGMITKFASGLGTAVGFVPAALLTAATGPAAPVVGGATLLSRTGMAARGVQAAQAVGVGAEEGRSRIEQARAEGKEITPGEELGSLLASGVVGITELAPIEKAISPIKTLLRGVKQSDADKIAPGFLNSFKRVLETAGLEAGQEFAANTLQDLIQKGIYDPELDLAESALGQGLEEGAYGGAIGAVLQTAIEVATKGRRARAYEALKNKERAEQLEKEAAALQEEEAQQQERNRQLRIKAGMGDTQQLALPAPRPQLEITPEEDPIVDPVGRFNANDLTESYVEEINQARKDNGQMPLDDFSIEDLVDAGVADQDIDSILAARMGFEAGKEVTEQDVLNAAAAKNIDTSGPGFASFLARVTGKDKLKGMTPPQLFAVFQSLEKQPRSDELRVLPYGTNATRFSEKQLNEAVRDLKESLEKNDMMAQSSAVRRIKKLTGLSNNRDVKALLQTAIDRGRLATTARPFYEVVDSEGKVQRRTDKKELADSIAEEQGLEVRERSRFDITLPKEPVEEIDGLDIREVTFQEGVGPEKFVIRSADKDITSVDTLEEANAKADRFNALRQKQADEKIGEARKRAAQISKNNAELEKLELEGKKGTVEYGKLANETSVKNEQLSKEAETLIEEATELLEPLEISARGQKPITRSEFTVFDSKGAPVNTLATRQEAESSAILNATTQKLKELIRLNQARKGPGAERIVKAAREELDRRTLSEEGAPAGLPVTIEGSREEASARLADVGVTTPEFQAKIDEVMAKLKPVLKRLGLEDVGIRLERKLRDANEPDKWAVDGYYVNKLIVISLEAQQGVFSTLNHEAIHALRALGAFTPAQWSALSRKAVKDWMAEFEIDQNYPPESNSLELRIEEAVAHAFAKYATSPKSAPPGMIAALARKLKAFFEAFGNALTGAGFNTADQIFQKIESGRIGRQRFDPGIRRLRGDTSAEREARYARRRQNDQLGFYSALGEKLDEVTQEFAQPAQWQNIINKLPGVTPQEIFWSGVNDYLAWIEESSPKARISKQDVLDYLASNNVKLEGQTIAEPSAEENRRAAANRFIQYILEPSFEIYNKPKEQKEILSLLGQWVKTTNSEQNWSLIERINKIADQAFDASGIGIEDALSEVRQMLPSFYEQYTVPGGTNYQINLIKNANPGHIEKRLLTEKVSQSHWKIPNILVHVRTKDRIGADGEKVLFVEEVQSDWGQGLKKEGELWVSTAPFISGPQFTVFKDGKEVLGKDKEGKDILKRYSTKEDATNAARKIDGEVVDLGIQATTEGWLALALKRALIRGVNEGYDFLAFANGDQNVEHYREFLEDDGKGMRQFYDNILPKVAQKVVSKLGGKLETVEMPADGLKQLGVKITPQLANKVREGVPMFSRRRIEPEAAAEPAIAQPAPKKPQSRRAEYIRYARALGRLNPNTLIVPERGGRADGVLGMMPPELGEREINLKVGYHDEATNRGKGATHLMHHASKTPGRDFEGPEDTLEKAVKTAQNTALSYDTIFEDGNAYVLYSSRMRNAIIVPRSGEDASIITMYVPRNIRKWGKPIWRGKAPVLQELMAPVRGTRVIARDGRIEPEAITPAQIARKKKEEPRFSRTAAEKDAEYMRALEAGDMATVQKMVDEAARDANYKTKSLHGTYGELFYVFDKEKLGEKTGAESAEKGFFSTDSMPIAEEYSRNIGMGAAFEIWRESGPLAEARKAAMAAPEGIRLQENNKKAQDYLKNLYETLKTKIENDVIAGWRSRLPPGEDTSFIDALLERRVIEANLVRPKIYETQEYKDAQEAAIKADMELESYLWDKISDSLPNRRVMNLYLRMENPKVYDAEGKSPAEFSLSDKIQDAIDNNHDSVVFKNIVDPKLPATHYVVFEPEQIKSSDPVTRDDAGNVIPLSQRFDKSKQDIRYSRRRLRDTEDPGLVAAVDRTTTKRREKGFIERMIEAISPQSRTALRQAILDRYAAIGEQTKQYAEFKKSDKHFLAETSAYAAALMSDRAAGVTAAAFRYGAPVYRNGYVTTSNFNGQVKGLMDILRPLAEFKDPFIYQMFQLYASSKRGARLNSEGKITQITPQDIKYGQMLENKYPVFKQVFSDYQNFNSKLVQLMKDTGVISDQNAKAFTQFWDYIPFYRQKDNEETVGPKIFSSISGVRKPRKYKGGDAPLADFIETLVQNTRAAIESSMNNVAAQRVMREMVELGNGREVKPGQPYDATALVNGELKFYQVDDPLLVESLKALDMPNMPFVDILAKPANFLRAMVTHDPLFIGRNLFRDSIQAWAVSGTNMMPVVDTFKQYVNVLAKSTPEARALIESGYFTGYDFAGDTQASAARMNELLQRQVGDLNIAQKAALPFSKLWELLEIGSNASDLASRAEVFKRVLKETGSEAEAIFQAQEIMNFARKGNNPLVRILTATIPFLNARMQGLDLLYRVGFGKTATANRKRQQAAFFTRMATLVGLSTLYWFLASDTEEYETATAETRDNNYIYGNIKLPIAFEIGVLTKVFPERILEYIFGNDTGKDLKKSFVRHLTSTFAVSPPQFMAPLVENVVNYSFFTGEPVVGQSYQRLDAPLQATSGTSLVAQKLGKEFNASPIKIDNLIKGYTGTLGSYLVAMVDAVIRTEDDPTYPERGIEQMPFVGRLYASPEGTGTINTFFEMKKELEIATTTINYLKNARDVEGLRDFLESGRASVMQVKSYLRSVEKKITKLNQIERSVNRSQMDPERKREILDALRSQKVRLTRDLPAIRKRLSERSFSAGGLVTSTGSKGHTPAVIGFNAGGAVSQNIVGENTGQITSAGRPLYRTPSHQYRLSHGIIRTVPSELVSEKSVTVSINGKWVNAPSIHDGVRYSEDEVMDMLLAGKIKPTSQHDTLKEAIEAATKRSAGLLENDREPKFQSGGEVQAPAEQSPTFRDLAYRATAATLGGPVDIATMMMRPFGYNVPDEQVVGGSEWMGKKLEGLGLVSEARSPVEEFLASLAVPTPSGMGKGAALGAEGLLGLLGATAYHGSPYRFKVFDPTKIGTGEGAQVYGYGHYFAESPDVARGYVKSTGYADAVRKFRDVLPDDAGFDDIAVLLEDKKIPENTKRVLRELKANDWLGFDYPAQAISEAFKPGAAQRYDMSDELQSAVNKYGNFYTVDIPDEMIGKMMDWDKPLSEQPKAVREALTTLARSDEQLMRLFRDLGPNAPANQAYAALTQQAVRLKKYEGMRAGIPEAEATPSLSYGQEVASRQLNELGIPGIRYLDQGSRAKGQGTSNFVVFPGNEEFLKILEVE